MTNPNTDPNAEGNRKPGAAPAYQGAEVRARDLSQVEIGWSVFSADGEELGKVAQIGPAGIAVPYGEQNERMMYIPVNYFEAIANRRVVLSQPAGLLIDMKLNEPPAEFPAQRERVGGVDHQPWRAEPGDLQPIAEPAAMPAQQELPSTDRQTDESVGMPAPGRSGEISASMPGGRMRMQAGDGSMTMESSAGTMRMRGIDAALQPPEPGVDQGGGSQPDVAPTISGDRVAREEISGGVRLDHGGVSTKMAPQFDTGSSTGPERAKAEDRSGETFEERSGYTALTSNLGYDTRSGPTSQPGVRDRQSFEPLRTPFGAMGTPGDGKERNVTDLNLAENRHPEGSAFDAQESTVGRAIHPDEPAIANRSIPGMQGGPNPPQPPDVPPGAVSRPDPKSSQ